MNKDSRVLTSLTLQIDVNHLGVSAEKWAHILEEIIAGEFAGWLEI